MFGLRLPELLILAAVLVGIVVVWAALRKKKAGMTHDATKTVNGDVDASVAIEAIRARTQNLGKVTQESPFVVEGFNSNLGGACQVTAVTFSVRKAAGKTVITASANQRPSLLAWVIGIVGVAASFVPTIAVVFWYVFSKHMVQRELWRVLDEVGEELEAPVGGAVSAAEPLPDSEMKTCPYCAETIKSAAVLCRFCGKNFAAA